ncbi:MAG: hypothetical protein ACREOY_14065 [Candidatus Dormibacteraceae bacterium]
MPWQWQWLLQLLQNDPSAFGQMAFVWLCAIALGISWYASRIPRRIAPADLERIHREVDEMKERIRDGVRDGRPVHALQQRLEGLRESLPSGDARR